MDALPFVVALLKIDEQFPHAPKTPTSGGKNRRSAEAPWHVEMLPSAPFCSSPGWKGGAGASFCSLCFQQAHAPPRQEGDSSSLASSVTRVAAVSDV